MKRPRKRFKSEQAILKAIDAAHRDAQSALAMAEKLHAEADAMFRESARMSDSELAYGLGEKAKEIRKQAKANERRANRLIESKAAALGDALAAFKTELLFGDDRSVPV